MLFDDCHLVNYFGYQSMLLLPQIMSYLINADFYILYIRKVIDKCKYRNRIPDGAFSFIFPCKVSKEQTFRNQCQVLIIMPNYTGLITFLPLIVYFK